MNAHLQRDATRTPLKSALGMGASGTGVQTWWLQRVTAIALIPLCIWFLFFLGGLIGQSYAQVQASIGWPVNAGLLITLGICLFWHGALGLKVIIEDYVHTRWLEVTLQIALRFGAYLGALACILAVLAVWLGPVRA